MSLKNVPILLLGLLLLWSIFIPVFEGADESGHFCHAEYIARLRRLPNFNIRDGCFLAYPPVYYVLISPIIARRSEAKFNNEQIQPNPEYVTNRKDKDVYAKYVHPQAELLFQWNPLLQTVHLIRLISVGMGIGIIGLTLKAAKKIKIIPWLSFTSVLLFFNPMFLHMFSLVSNLVLVSFLAALFIYLEIVNSEKKKSKKTAFFQGLILGLGVITKINILGLALGYLLTQATSKQKLKEKLYDGLLIASGFIVSSGWYIWRTIKLYGEPFEINVASSFRGASMNRMQKLGLINYWSSFPDTLFRTFWSGYGLVKVWLPEIVVVSLLLVFLLALSAVLLNYRRLPRSLKLAGYYLVGVFLFHLLINVKTEAYHAKDIFTAYLPLAILFGYGIGDLTGTGGGGKMSLGKKGQAALVVAVGLFYAKFELVRLLKAGLSWLGLAGFYAPETIALTGVLFSLGVKILTVFFMVWALVKLLGSIKPSLRVWQWLVRALVAADLLVLAYSSFLLYS